MIVKIANLIFECLLIDIQLCIAYVILLQHFYCQKKTFLAVLFFNQMIPFPVIFCLVVTNLMFVCFQNIHN